MRRSTIKVLTGSAAVVWIMVAAMQTGCGGGVYSSNSETAQRTEPGMTATDEAPTSTFLGGEQNTQGSFGGYQEAKPDEFAVAANPRTGLPTARPSPQPIKQSKWGPTGAKPAATAPVAEPIPVPVPSSEPFAFTLTPGQELWIIERPAQDRFAPRTNTDDFPGSPTLMTQWGGPGQSPREVPVPLEHTDVRASIAGCISSVNVRQSYTNPYASKIEAVYVFPLPDDASLSDFVMTIGSRSIRGVIREREQAERIYNQARAQGHHASLMTQERSNIFTQKVANIEPSEKVDIDVTYFHTLGFANGAYEFVFPMVVGPRFNPASSCRGPAQSPEVQYLRPQERCGTDISVTVDIDAAMPIESLESPTHQISVLGAQSGSPRATVQLSAFDSIPNRDFVLRYRVAGGQIKPGLITQADSDGSGGFFSLVLVPPEDLRYTPRGPVEMVFVVDCSGSMSGEPLALAQRAVSRAVQQLRPEDSFQIIRFSDTCSMMTQRPIPACGREIADGVDFTSRLQAGGGTMMLKGLEPALELRGEWNRTRFICLLSDGLLGNEQEVLGQLRSKLGDSRIFSVGIGSAPNRMLLNAMSRVGRGAAGYIATEQDADEVMDLFIQRVSNAAMTDLRIDWPGADVTETYPKRLPDLYVGRPVVVYGRYHGAPQISMRVSGRVGGERQTIAVPMTHTTGCQALSRVWARQKIQDLDENAWWGGRPGGGASGGPNAREIKQIALQHGLMSAYTSFIAVDAAGRTQGSYGTSVPVPVNMPQGTRYETTVGDR